MELIVSNLTKKYNKKIILNQCNYSFVEGRIYALLGRNGAGKTTFFNCLNKDVDAEEGEMTLDGQKLGNEHIGYVVSTIVVPEFLSAREFIDFFIEANKDEIQDLKTADEYLEMVLIQEEDRDRLIKDFSHGMKVKVQMLVNIMIKPQVLLLDEPLTSLDVVASEEMKKLFRLLSKHHIIILSTHIMELALDLCDEIVLLSEGQLMKVDSEDLNDAQLKEKIIAKLKGESYE